MFVNLNSADSSTPTKITSTKNTKIIGDNAPAPTKAEALKELAYRFGKVDEVFRALPDMPRSEMLVVLRDAIPALKRTQAAFNRTKIKDFRAYMTHAIDEVIYLRQEVIRGNLEDLEYPCIRDALKYFREQWHIEDPQPGQFSFDVESSDIHEDVKIGSVVVVDLPAFQFKRKFQIAEFNTMDVHGYLGFNAQYLLEFSAKAASQGRAAALITEVLDEILHEHGKVFGLVSEEPYCYGGKAYFWIMPRAELKRFGKALNYEVGIHKWGTLNADVHEQLSGAPVEVSEDDSRFAAADSYVEVQPEAFDVSAD